MSQRGSVPVLHLDNHSSAWADNHNVDFVGLTTRIWMREVGQDEGGVLPFGTTKLLVDSVEGSEFARIGKRTTWYMYNTQANPPVSRHLNSKRTRRNSMEWQERRHPSVSPAAVRSTLSQRL